MSDQFALGQIVGPELPETRGGPRETKDIDFVYEIARKNPGQWVVACLNELRPNARNWIIRKYYDLKVSSRSLEHNSDGRVTVFVKYVDDLE